MKKCSKGELSNANPQACGGNAMADVPLLRHDKASEEMPSEPLRAGVWRLIDGGLMMETEYVPMEE